MSNFNDNVFNQRQFRIVITFDPNQKIAVEGQNFPTAVALMNGLRSFLFPQELKRYSGAGSPEIFFPNASGNCIYCDSFEYNNNSSRKMGDEHIIAAGLGGNLVLSNACCSTCEGIICSYEGTVLRKVFSAARRQLGLKPSRKRRPSPKTFSCIAEVNGQEISIELPIQVHPGLMMLPIYMAPGIMASRPEGMSTMCGFWSCAVNFDPINLSNKKITSIKCEIDTVLFSQMLAKIAHSFLVAELGLDAFQPTLKDFIIKKFDKDEKISDEIDYLGGAVDLEPASSNFHEIGWYQYGYGSLLYLVVRIRLFAKLGAPTYHVVAGYVRDQRLFMELTKQYT